MNCHIFISSKEQQEMSEKKFALSKYFPLFAAYRKMRLNQSTNKSRNSLSRGKKTRCLRSMIELSASDVVAYVVSDLAPPPITRRKVPLFKVNLASSNTHILPNLSYLMGSKSRQTFSLLMLCCCCSFDCDDDDVVVVVVDFASGQSRRMHDEGSSILESMSQLIVFFNVRRRRFLPCHGSRSLAFMYFTGGLRTPHFGRHSSDDFPDFRSSRSESRLLSVSSAWLCCP